MPCSVRKGEICFGGLVRLAINSLLVVMGPGHKILTRVGSGQPLGLNLGNFP